MQELKVGFYDVMIAELKGEIQTMAVKCEEEFRLIPLELPKTGLNRFGLL